MRARWIATGGVVLVLMACSSPPDEGKPIRTVAPSADDSPPPAAREPYTPVAGDFSLAIRVLSKQCFGTAGCQITYTVVPTYRGPRALDTDHTYRVVYIVTGDESGPITNNFSITGTSAEMPTEENASTASSAVVLVAKVSQVVEE